jgi:hypothetical protein
MLPLENAYILTVPSEVRPSLHPMPPMRSRLATSGLPVVLLGEGGVEGRVSWNGAARPRGIQIAVRVAAKRWFRVWAARLRFRRSPTPRLSMLLCMLDFCVIASVG